ncbi:MAG: hypothetical protein JW966_09770 [Anaerolineae bacterium]|nr:hypothetical protein [Anaerolineae bacterium]
MSSVPAFEHRSQIQKLSPFAINGNTIGYLAGAAHAHCALFNLTGSPVVVLPLTRSIEGLPIGVQVVGRRWCDMALLDVAAALTGITGPVKRPPGY